MCSYYSDDHDEDMIDEAEACLSMDTPKSIGR